MNNCSQSRSPLIPRRYDWVVGFIAIGIMCGIVISIIAFSIPFNNTATRTSEISVNSRHDTGSTIWPITTGILFDASDTATKLRAFCEMNRDTAICCGVYCGGNYYRYQSTGETYSLLNLGRYYPDAVDHSLEPYAIYLDGQIESLP